ncbi:hypothetical protein [Pseudoduganella chitinolytica]|uniref:Lipoprotein n=1 Tax=Pseudoduganella chitinolytica TaxID=34070 RepID=A0ABY8B574_9BURK|nr:hypothetical protein [Pseudoduganella chitinolytica]WEF30940.1 hypothetical protein PX653_15835 [Pseudoduganella chitinolytica]
MRRIETIFSSCVAAGMLVGCTTVDPTLGGILKIESDGQPISKSGANQRQPVEYTSTSGKKAQEAGCYFVDGLKKSVDVDTLYGRAMRTFAFKSPEQVAIHKKTIDRTYTLDNGYKHEKQAGSYYHLAQTVRYELSPGQARPIWLELQFTKNGTGADVVAEYCVNPADSTVNNTTVRQQIQQKIRSALFSG